MSTVSLKHLISKASNYGQPYLFSSRLKGLHLRCSTTPSILTKRPKNSPKVESVFQKILQLDTVEVHLLTELVNERMGVKLSDAQRAALHREGKGNISTASVKEPIDTVPTEQVKTLFELKLVSFEDKSKIKVIKEVRAITGLGLKEAKELVEGVPKVLRKDIKREEAESLKKKLDEAGAKVEIH